MQQRILDLHDNNMYFRENQQSQDNKVSADMLVSSSANQSGLDFMTLKGV